jgi:hypothetical protein
VTCLAYLATRGQFVDDPGRDQPQLLEVWIVTLWCIKQGAALKVLFAALLVVISAAVAAVGRVVERLLHLLLLCFLCLAGIVASTWVMIQLSDPQALATLRWFSDFQTDAEVNTAVTWLFGALIGWFGGFMIVLLRLQALARKSPSADPPAPSHASPAPGAAPPSDAET